MEKLFNFKKFISNKLNEYKNVAKIEVSPLKTVVDQFNLLEKGIKSLGYNVEFLQKDIKREAENFLTCTFTIDGKKNKFLIFKNGTTYLSKDSEDEYIGILMYYNEFLKELKKLLKEVLK
jgi:hypothetical protein